MNKRIEELRRQVAESFDPLAIYSDSDYSKEYDHRLAKLIVEECCAVMNDHDSFYGEAMMSPLIKKHFGIEE